MTVYVRWYGNILQGELLDGECMGMKQVRIPLDGHHPIALFTPDHVYDSPEQVTEKSSINCQDPTGIPTKSQIFVPIKPEITYIDKYIEIWKKESHRMILYNDISLDDNREMVEAFKRDNWDQEHNHLRIDKLDEFYQLWRMVMRPSGYVEAEAPITLPSHKEEPVIAEAPKRIVSDERMEELKQQLKTKLDPKSSKKMLRSTGQQQFNNATQLSLFEL